MSHGSSSDGKCEPNLIPLLDLVLQLVMFFMLCANFVMDETSADIILPDAPQARPVDETGKRLILQVSAGEAKEGARETMTVLIEGEAISPANEGNLRPKLETFYGNKEATAARREETVVVIKADLRVTFGNVHQVIRAAQGAGYKKIQFRAVVRESVK